MAKDWCWRTRQILTIRKYWQGQQWAKTHICSRTSFNFKVMEYCWYQWINLNYL
jgi:hypothetical protein